MRAWCAHGFTIGISHRSRPNFAEQKVENLRALERTVCTVRGFERDAPTAVQFDVKKSGKRRVVRSCYDNILPLHLFYKIYHMYKHAHVIN